MALSSDYVLQQVVVEVQYQRGVVYYDKCGSLMLKLEDALGKPPFEGAVAPTMQNGELRSLAERIHVSYAPKAMSVTQVWTRNPVRVETVAPLAWEQVADTLNVGRSVTRCGVRFIKLWEVGDVDEAKVLLASCPLLETAPQASDAWHRLAGDSIVRGWAIVLEDAHGRVRIALDIVETNVQGGTLPAEMVPLVPKCAISLDLDYTLPDEKPFTLTKGSLKDFIRTSWQRSKLAATTIRKQLGE